MPNFYTGGGERMACHLMRALDKERFEVAAVSMFNPSGGDLEMLLKEAQIPIWFLGKRLGPDLRMYNRIDRVFRHFRPHVVHTHRYMLRYALPIMLYRKTPVMVHTVHSTAENEVGRGTRLLHRFAFRHGVIPVAIAPGVLESLVNVYGNNNYPMIPNGIPVHTYSNPKLGCAEWRKREGLLKADVIFTCVARLDPPKNQPLLVEAFLRGPAADSRAKLLLVGSGGWKSELESQISANGLQEQVRLLGYRRDIPDMLGSIDVFVLPSSWEGNPLCVMEAMAAGKPVIASRVGGIPDLVENELTGLLVLPDNRSALTEAMNELLKNQSKRQVMGKHAAQQAAERFSVESMTKTYEKLYEKAFRYRRA
jgi:glycosyltransferase involved in cell wall biosynthesis